MTDTRTPYATVRDLHQALERALMKTLGEVDPQRQATMADVGSAFLAMQDRLQDLTFVDGSRRRVS